MTAVQVHRLAALIEWIHAGEMAQLARRYGRRAKRADFYDPHAATELAMLIETSLAPRSRRYAP